MGRLTGATQQHARRGRQRRERQLRVGARAVPRDEDIAEQPGALAHGAQHGRRRVGRQLVGGVQEQVVPQHAGRAQLALVQGGARVGGGGIGVVGRRGRNEERLRPVPELLLLRCSLWRLLSFGDGRVMLPGNFLKPENDPVQSNTRAFPTGLPPVLREGQLLFGWRPPPTCLTPGSCVLKNSHIHFSDKASSAVWTRRKLWFWRKSRMSGEKSPCLGWWE